MSDFQRIMLATVLFKSEQIWHQLHIFYLKLERFSQGRLPSPSGAICLSVKLCCSHHFSFNFMPCDFCSRVWRTVGTVCLQFLGQPGGQTVFPATNAPLLVSARPQRWRAAAPAVRALQVPHRPGRESGAAPGSADTVTFEFNSQPQHGDLYALSGCVGSRKPYPSPIIYMYSCKIDKARVSSLRT